MGGPVRARSYGFRPGRGCHDAIESLFSTLRGNSARIWILDADLAGAFDKISHGLLLEMLGGFPARGMIAGWLKAGVFEAGKGFAPTGEGTPQGGIISPLLLNIALHGLEEAAGVQYRGGIHAGTVRDGCPALTRYADDLVVCCHSRQQAEQVEARLAGWLEPEGWRSTKPTRIVPVTEGFDFLGFSLRRYPNGKLLIKPGATAIKRFRSRLAKEFHALRGSNVAAVLAKIVPIVRGWVAYYRTVVSSRVFAALTDYLWKLTYKWACWSHPNKPKHWIAGRYFGKFSKFRNDRWVFGDKDTGAYLPKPAWTDIVRHTLVKSGASPDDPAQAGYGRTPPEGETPAGLLHRAPAVQAGRAVQPVRGEPADPRPASPVPPGLGTLVPVGHQEGDQGGLPGPPRHAQCRTQQPNTPRTRHLPPEQASAPAGGKHPAAADDLNRPSGLLGPCARERACPVLRGPRCSNAPGYPASPRTDHRDPGRGCGPAAPSIRPSGGR